jgi:hypothetical protein
LSSSRTSRHFQAAAGEAPFRPAGDAAAGFAKGPPDTEERSVLLAALVALALFPLLLRRYDDNTLVSWRWVFHFSDTVVVFAFHVLGIAAAYFLAFLSLPERRPAVFLFSFSFLITALLWGEPEAIIDSSRYFTQAKHLAVYGPGYFLREWGGEIFAWTDLPLAPFIYGLVFRLFGESRVWIQFLNSLMFAATVVLTFLLGRRLWDEHVGFLGGLFLTGIPYLLIQVPLMLVDVPTMFFSTLSVFLFLSAVESGGAFLLALSSLSVVLALLTKYSAWVFHGSLLAVTMAVLMIREDASVVLRRGVSVALMSAALLGSILLLKAGTVASQLALLRSYQWPGLNRWGESFFSTLFFQTHPFISLAAACSIVVAVRKRDIRYLITAWMWIVIVLIQARRIRYVIPAMPMLALMAAYGLQVLSGERLRRFCAWCAVGFSLVISLAVYRPFLGSTSLANLQRAGAFLDSRDERGAARVYATHRGEPLINPAVAVPLLDLFTSRRIFFMGGGPRPSPEKIQRSTYRFTWEYRNPGYYEPPGEPQMEEAALVVIAGDPDDALPEELRAEVRDYPEPEVFDRSAVFRFKTLATVFLPEREAGGGGKGSDMEK